MLNLIHLDISNLDPEVAKELGEDIIEAIKMNSSIIQICSQIQERLIIDEFMNSKHINIELMKYAMELCDKEEKQKIKREKELRKKTSGLEDNIFSTQKSVLINLIVFGLFALAAMYLYQN